MFLPWNMIVDYVGILLPMRRRKIVLAVFTILIEDIIKGYWGNVISNGSSTLETLVTHLQPVFHSWVPPEWMRCILITVAITIIFICMIKSRRHGRKEAKKPTVETTPRRVEEISDDEEQATLPAPSLAPKTTFGQIVRDAKGHSSGDSLVQDCMDSSSDSIEILPLPDEDFEGINSTY